LVSIRKTIQTINNAKIPDEDFKKSFDNLLCGTSQQEKWVYMGMIPHEIA
jgi:hypothetical protein